MADQTNQPDRLTLIINSMEGPLQLVLARTGQAQPRSGEADDRPPARETAPAGGHFTTPGATAGQAWEIVAALCWEPDGQGAETLIPNLAALLAENGMKPAQIRQIACVRGPGSFTGIRLALSTALGLSRALPGRPAAAGLDYLPLLARTAETEPRLPPTGSLWTLTHARRAQVHIQGFALGAGLSPLCPPQGCLLEQACALIEQTAPDNAPLYLMGSGLARNRDAFAGRFPQARLLDAPLYPSPACLAEAAAKAAYAQKPIEPLYLRASDAEENLPYIAAGLGLDPHQAMLDLLKLTGRGA